MNLDPTIDSPMSLLAPKGNFRWRICALLFFGTGINYVDRQILGLLHVVIAKSLHWSDQDYTNIVSVFQFAYAFGYLFGGQFLDYIGVKRGYPLAATIWSGAAILQGVSRSLLGFTGATAALGLSEGCNFPAAIRTVADWFPIKDRSLATGLFNSAAGIALIISPLIIPVIAKYYSWHVAFLVVGLLGLVWVLIWLANFDFPENHPKITQEERDYIQQGRQKAIDFHIPVTELLGMRATWAYVIATALSSSVWWFFIFWFPSFVTKRFHKGVVEAGHYTAIMYAITVLGSIGAGYLATNLIHRGWSVNAARKMALLVPALCVLPVYFASRVNNVWFAVLIVGVAMAGHQGYSANLYTFVSDVMPRKAISSLIGFGGFAAGMTSIVMAQAAGQVLKFTHSYNLIFAIDAPMYLFALLLIHVLVPKIEPHKQSNMTSSGA